MTGKKTVQTSCDTPRRVQKRGVNEPELTETTVYSIIHVAKFRLLRLIFLTTLFEDHETFRFADDLLGK